MNRPLTLYTVTLWVSIAIVPLYTLYGSGIHWSVYTLAIHCTVYTMVTLISVYTVHCTYTLYSVYTVHTGQRAYTELCIRRHRCIGIDVDVDIDIGGREGYLSQCRRPHWRGGIDEREPETGGPIYKPRYQCINPGTVRQTPVPVHSPRYQCANPRYRWIAPSTVYPQCNGIPLLRCRWNKAVWNIDTAVRSKTSSCNELSCNHSSAFVPSMCSKTITGFAI